MIATVLDFVYTSIEYSHLCLSVSGFLCWVPFQKAIALLGKMS